MSSRRVANALLVLSISAVFITRSNAKENRVTMPETQKLLRTSFRDALNKLTPNDFTPIARFEDMVSNAYFDSRHWMRVIFGAAHDPDGDVLGARHSYYIWRGGGEPGFDMLRHRFTLGSRTVIVTETAGIIDVAVRLDSADEAWRLNAADRASKIASWLLQAPADIRFVPDPSEPDWLVSNLEAPDKKIADWKERIYAITSDSGVDFFLYKEDPRLRPVSRNYSIWFDTDFRNHPPQPAR